VTGAAEVPEYASAAAVAGLAREVEGLRRAVEQLRVVPRRIEEVAALVARLAEQNVAAGEGADEGTVTWLDLPSDPGGAATPDAERVLLRLMDWLGAVYLRYADAARTLPACWLWHPEVIEELTWLRQAWLAAYSDPEARIALAGDWHDRQRPGVVRRIKEYAGMCSIETHQGQQPGAPVVPLAGAALSIADWWATRRPAAPPEPGADEVAEASAYHRLIRGTRR
jgi:hypothetical protein